MHTPLPYLANGWADCVQILCVNRDQLDNCFAHVWCGVHLHVRTCIPLGGTERRLVKVDATRTTNLRSAALPQKRCLAGNRRLVEHGDNNYSLELLFSLWETNLSYRNMNRDPLDNCFAHVWCGVHLHVRTCIPLGGTERRLVKLDATRTTNLRSAALPQKRCLAGNRRLVEHRDNNYSL